MLTEFTRRPRLAVANAMVRAGHVGAGHPSAPLGPPLLAGPGTWCPRQDSNLRHTAPEADALSAELRGRATAGRPGRPGPAVPRTEANCSAAAVDRTPGQTAAAPRRRILAATCPPETTWPRPSARPSPPWPSGTGSTSRPTRPRSISSARPGGSTATGRPTSPWSWPSGPGPTPGPWPTSLVEALEADPPPTPRHRGRRAGLHQLPAGRRVAARRPGRAAGPGRGGLRPSRRRPRRAGPGRVHLGQPDRADPRRQRVVGELRRRPGPGAGPSRLPGEPRVLRQRHRRSDPDPRGEPAGPPSRAARCPRAATRAST